MCQTTTTSRWEKRPSGCCLVALVRRRIEVRVHKKVQSRSDEGRKCCGRHAAGCHYYGEYVDKSSMLCVHTEINQTTARQRVLKNATVSIAFSHVLYQTFFLVFVLPHSFWRRRGSSSRSLGQNKLQQHRHRHRRCSNGVLRRFRTRSSRLDAVRRPGGDVFA